MEVKTSTLSIEVLEYGFHLDYGQRVYGVYISDHETYREKCFICGGTKKVLIKGTEFSCPACSSYSYSANNYGSISLNNYKIDEFIVNKLIIQGEEVKSLYAKHGHTQRSLPRISYEGFTKRSTNLSSVQTRGFSSAYLINAECQFERYLSGGRISSCWFIDISLAKSYVKSLHEIQEKNLLSFNEKHGTDYPYPFKY